MLYACPLNARSRDSPCEPQHKVIEPVQKNKVTGFEYTKRLGDQATPPCSHAHGLQQGEEEEKEKRDNNMAYTFHTNHHRSKSLHWPIGQKSKSISLAPKQHMVPSGHRRDHGPSRSPTYHLYRHVGASACPMIPSVTNWPRLSNGTSEAERGLKRIRLCVLYKPYAQMALITISARRKHSSARPSATRCPL